MFFSWFANRRRRKILAEPFPAQWLAYLNSNMRHYALLPADDQDLVQQVTQVFVAEKHWAGGGGLVVTDEMKVTVAAQASLLVLGFSEPYCFDHVPSIILHPRRFAWPLRLLNQWWIVDNREHSGEAWPHGPIVLAWEEVVAGGRNELGGFNVVLHEFAHHLDSLNGEFDGEPPLGRQQWADWDRVTEAEYLRLVGGAQRNEVTLLDHYGATNRVEFFAVATECFFEHPTAMRQRHAELYGVLRKFYCQDPAQWCPDAPFSPDRQPPSDWESRDGNQLDPVRQSELEAQLAALGSAESLFRFGVECLAEKQYDLAERAFSRVLDQDPADVEALQGRATARAKLGRYTEALADAEESLRLDEDDGNGYLARGAALLGLRQYERAAADLKWAVREERNNPEAFYLRGLARAGLGQWRPAVRDFSYSIAMRPHCAEAYYHRAHAYRKLGAAAKADADLETAFQLDPHVGWRK